MQQQRTTVIGKLRIPFNQTGMVYLDGVDSFVRQTVVGHHITVLMILVDLGGAQHWYSESGARA